MLSSTDLLGASLVAVATVAGAWLAGRRPRQRRIWFAASAGVLLIIALLHMVPNAWTGARDASVWPPSVPVAAVAACTAAALAARAGCGCRAHRVIIRRISDVPSNMVKLVEGARSFRR